MSRIHDALRQAHQEREIALQGEGHPGALPGAAAVPAQGSAASGEDFLRFEDICARCARPVWEFDSAGSVFSLAHAAGPGAEQFRTLRSRLYRLCESHPLRSLVVSSALAGEGKTFVASNLAHAIAQQSDCRVLLIDADLRCPRLHQLLGAPAAPGLADYLRGEASEFDVIQHGGANDLCFIPSGGPAPNPTELLANDRFRKLLARLSPVFEWIIIDSPPVLPVSDAGILTRVCGSVLMVVGAGTTGVEVAQRACQEMHEKNLLGIVLNRAEQGRAYGGQYPYTETREKLV
jgi:succinoglycan biosynthesis transport protein ExoP